MRPKSHTTDETTIPQDTCDTTPKEYMAICRTAAQHTNFINMK